MRLQNKRYALDCGSIGAFAALDEALLQQLPGIGELRNAPASGAFFAEVVREAFAIGGLCEHARESEFAQAARSGEEQGVGDTSAAESAAKRCDNAFVAKKFRKSHVSTPLACGS